MALFKLRKGGGPRDLETSMAGLKLGSNVLQVDGDDPGLIASLAGVVGLSGLACAVTPTGSKKEAFLRAAAKAGVLVEVKVAPVSNLPYDSDSFDLVVIKQALGALGQNDRVLCLQETFRVLRGGGRCLVIDAALRGGLGVIFSRQSFDRHYLADGGAQPALRQEGFLGVRLLADRDGFTFVEGAKQRTSTVH